MHADGEGSPMPVAVMFPGQGAQKQGMGAAWRHHPAWQVVQRAEGVVKRPLADLLVERPLDRTADAQLAVLLCSLMAWEAARPSLPDVVGFGGHSLGQVTALIAAGTPSFTRAPGGGPPAWLITSCSRCGGASRSRRWCRSAPTAWSRWAQVTPSPAWPSAPCPTCLPRRRVSPSPYPPSPWRCPEMEG